MIQLELFPLSEVERLNLELKKVKESADSVRRSAFARLNEQEKMCLDLQSKYMDLHNKYEKLCLSVSLEIMESRPNLP